MDTCCVSPGCHIVTAQDSANRIQTAINLSTASVRPRRALSRVARAATQEAWPPEPTLLAAPEPQLSQGAQ